MIFISIVGPITIYASESWAIIKANKRKLEIVETDLFRRLSRLDYVTKDIITRRTSIVVTITEIIQQNN